MAKAVFSLMFMKRNKTETIFRKKINEIYN